MGARCWRFAQRTGPMVEYWIMRLRSTIITAILAVGAVASGNTRALCDGPNADVKALFVKVAAAYRNFKSVSYEMTSLAADPASRQSSIEKSKLSLLKPNKLEADLNDSQSTFHIVADGKAIYVTSTRESSKYMKVQDSGFTAMIEALRNVGLIGNDLITILLTDRAADTKIVPGIPVFVRRAPDAVVNGDKCDVVYSMTNNGRGYVLYTFAFAKSDHFLRKFTAADPTVPSRPVITETYTSVKVNPALAPTLFRFTAPKGSVAFDPSVPTNNYDPRLKVGASPIPITGADLAGKSVSLTQYKGKVLLVDFWATWCGPCIHELPNVVAAYGRYHAQGFDVVGITLDNKNAKKKVQEFIASRKMPWREIYDGKYWSAANATAYGLHGIPFSLLIGRDGKVAAVAPNGPSSGACN